jgi:hypothetical protein
MRQRIGKIGVTATKKYTDQVDGHKEMFPLRWRCIQDATSPKKDLRRVATPELMPSTYLRYCLTSQGDDPTSHMYTAD